MTEVFRKHGVFVLLSDLASGDHTSGWVLVGRYGEVDFVSRLRGKI